MAARRNFTMSIRVKGWIAAAVVVAFVGLPLTAGAGQAPPAGAPPAAQAQAASASGELVKVDATAKSLTIKADGRDEQFTFNDQTKITGAQGAAGLATMEGSQVTVMYGKDRVASEIRVTPKKQ
jgi:Cu/Ag efflux protein CusF